MQEPDKSVAECASRLVVEVSGSAVVAVERASSRTLVEGAERPLISTAQAIQWWLPQLVRAAGLT